MQNNDEIIATNEGSGNSNIPLHPAGQMPAVCLDIIDRGLVRHEWQGKVDQVHKITLRFFCGHWWNNPETGQQEPLWVDAWFRLSTHQKANLRKFLDSWRGVPMSEQEAERFIVSRLLHVPALIQVSHNATPNRTYVNINSIMALPRGMQSPQLPPNYVRVKDRPPREQTPQPNGQVQQVHGYPQPGFAYGAPPPPIQYQPPPPAQPQYQQGQYYTPQPQQRPQAPAPAPQPSPFRPDEDPDSLPF